MILVFQYTASCPALYCEWDTLVTGWLMCALERGMPAGDPDCNDSLKWIGMDWIWIDHWTTFGKVLLAHHMPLKQGQSNWEWLELGLVTMTWHQLTLVALTLRMKNWWEFPLGLPRITGATITITAWIGVGDYGMAPVDICGFDFTYEELMRVSPWSHRGNNPISGHKKQQPSRALNLFHTTYSTS